MQHAAAQPLHELTCCFQLVKMKRLWGRLSVVAIVLGVLLVATQLAASHEPALTAHDTAVSELRSARSRTVRALASQDDDEDDTLPDPDEEKESSATKVRERGTEEAGKKPPKASETPQPSNKKKAKKKKKKKKTTSGSAVPRGIVPRKDIRITLAEAVDVDEVEYCKENPFDYDKCFNLWLRVLHSRARSRKLRGNRKKVTMRYVRRGSVLMHWLSDIWTAFVCCGYQGRSGRG